MRNILTILLIAISIHGYAQTFTPLRDPVPPNASLLQVGDKMMLIHPLDAKKSLHKWVSFDSSLHIISTKRIISPDWQNTIAQTYLAMKTCIIRVDQLMVNDSLFISLFKFDVYGNLKGRLDFDHLPFSGEKLKPMPFYMTMSADRQMLALVQPMVSPKEQVELSAFVVNERLNLISSRQQAFHFDGITSDILMSLVDTDGTLFVPVADKFDSYRLSSSVQLLPLSAGSKPVVFNFDRKKLKDVRLTLEGGEVKLMAMFSVEADKKEVAGVLNARLQLNGTEPQITTYHLYDNEMRNALARKFGEIGKKKNFFNQLYLLPRSDLSKSELYGVLITEQVPIRVHKTSAAVPNASEDLDRVRREVAVTNSLMSSRTARGQSMSPMNAAEASVYAASRKRTIGSGNPEPATRNNTPQAMRKDNHRQLLYFDHSSTSPTVSYQFARINGAEDPLFDFFTYVEADGRYHAIHYQLPTLRRSQLTSTSLGADGKFVKKILLEDKTRVLVSRYPTLVLNGKKFIAIYEDRNSGEMGLVGVQLY